MAIEAGCDAVLICHTLALQNDAIDTIARSARSGPLSRERLAEAAARVEVLQKFARPASAIDPSQAAARCGTAEHRAFAASLEELDARAERRRDPTEWRT
jgi:beta-N-acetylhexosaminidase